MRAEKLSMATEIKNRTEDAVYLFVTDYRGLSVSQSQDLRGRLRDSNAKMMVVNNKIFSKASVDLSYEEICTGLTGPSAIIYGTGDVVQTAKVLRKFIKENELPVIKIGSLRGSVLTEGDVTSLANLPSREELLAKVVGTIAAPLSQVVGVLNQKLVSLLYVLRAVQEKKEQ